MPVRSKTSSDSTANFGFEDKFYLKAQPGHFLAQVIGGSMNRRIPNGSWCLFRTLLHELMTAKSLVHKVHISS